MSRTTLFASQGAQVRFLNGMTSTSGSPSVGIMHSKIVAIDDQLVFTGSNNFSSTGFVTNEENSIVLRAPTFQHFRPAHGGRNFGTHSPMRTSLITPLAGPLVPPLTTPVVRPLLPPPLRHPESFRRG